jgi:hypothetical protein
MNTELLVITDCSGSMARIAKDCEGGFKAFLDEQKKVPGECRVTAAMFESNYTLQYQGKPLAEVEGIQIIPMGMTAMYDAIGRTLAEQGKRIAEEKWAQLVIVAIITDGQENASKEYQGQQVKDMIAHAEKNGWRFIFMAANQDAFAASRGYGMSINTVSKSFGVTGQSVQAMYQSFSADTVTLRSGQDVTNKNEKL